MDRLLGVWDATATSVSPLEHATRVFITLWTLQFEGVDLRLMWDWNFTAHREAVHETAAALARAIDDEVTWHLGNRPDLAILIADDAEPLTVGEMLDQLTMYAVLLDKWPYGHGEPPFGRAFMVLGRLYDSLATNLVLGSARQPRRRSHGAPPISRPGLVDLIATPPEGAQ
ncbi:hypothetical protein [Nocardia asteroides]|uniref:hypothetical protein n=1 Tax=Nocardia asteroides TaxID=1824 RepID=UPI001E470DFC|nr:hypothetical protein [Nocardia asteroides]UGT59863.1 hypothetical protein LTT61_21900 [Nocardia asteroides]